MEPPAPADSTKACYQMAFNHELPNHLVAILGLIQLVRLELTGNLSQEIEELFNRVQAAVQRTQKVVHMLAAIGQVGPESDGAGCVSLEEVAHEAGQALGKLFPTAQLEFDWASSAPRLFVGRAALHSVLFQVMHRAAQASDGIVRIRIESRATPDFYELDVIDTGPPLSERERRFLFEPFTGDHRQEANRGLGLFLARLWMKSWGGAIAVDADSRGSNRIRLHWPGAVLSPSRVTAGEAATLKG